MDNAPIHKPSAVRSVIEKRGYECVYLSPFLNSIEEFWQIEFGVKRQPFDTNDTLTSRVIESCSKVSLSDYKGWIGHSVSFFERCLALK